MTAEMILAAAGETGFAIEPDTSVWTISLWHQDARARLTAQRTAAGGWQFLLVYAGGIHLVEPTDGADLIRALTDTLGVDARSASASQSQGES